MAIDPDSDAATSAGHTAKQTVTSSSRSQYRIARGHARRSRHQTIIQSLPESGVVFRFRQLQPKLKPDFVNGSPGPVPGTTRACGCFPRCALHLACGMLVTTGVTHP